jgi:hypothetical protein
VTRPWQMRRRARRMRRYGMQPMVVIDHDSQLPDLVVVIVARAIWRYRSELAPLFIAAAMVLAAMVLHRTHTEWWPWLLTATTVASVSTAILSQHVGLAERNERWYAAAVIAAIGGWLTAATAIGATRRPLLHVLLIGGVIMAVPWWTHRRRRAKVRVERKLNAWPEISQAVGLTGSRVQSALVDVWGWRARLALARGQTIQDVTAKIHALESALGTYRGALRVYPTRDDLANRVELRVLDIDPHADAIPWPGPSVATITEPIELGPFEDATPARVLLLRRHALIGGIAGSGKSGGINVLIANLSACRDVIIWAIDLKRGMELQPWKACIDRLATTPEQARVLLRDAVAILDARADLQTATGRRVWEPTPDLPALVLVIDEYAELADEAAEAIPHCDSIARRGRAVAVTLIAATQRPTQKAMGKGAVRSQMDVRISFRVRERKDTDLILGQGMLSAGWHPHTLNAPGKFLISAPEHDTPRRARAFLLSDETVADTAARHSTLRPPLDEASRRALERAADTPIDDPEHPDDADDAEPGNAPGHGPEASLWDALTGAPEDGISVPDLMKATHMSRPWIYQRLSQLAQHGQVTQVSYGRWRATGSHTP